MQKWRITRSKRATPVAVSWLASPLIAASMPLSRHPTRGPGPSSSAGPSRLLSPGTARQTRAGALAGMADGDEDENVTDSSSSLPDQEQEFTFEKMRILLQWTEESDEEPESVTLPGYKIHRMAKELRLVLRRRLQKKRKEAANKGPDNN
ncbi:uncharacterized protein LOC100834461 isoform X1 [Brachypodium distachyon]|uniref:uncharacterized protein LOC100834461 isoform X1 n=1 Tax=Brachypodium distachyon TaxID=15368 RepID=UPI00071DAF13|nr:uncharacterized protein LOC100834461 isoform X1 [Brachypodium distachyon]|eukprot:XP_014751096.1 uncharacterized protein LOC100834461 isoform X1 [Brachypodium distachyon]